MATSKADAASKPAAKAAGKAAAKPRTASSKATKAGDKLAAGADAAKDEPKAKPKRTRKKPDAGLLNATSTLAPALPKGAVKAAEAAKRKRAAAEDKTGRRRAKPIVVEPPAPDPDLIAAEVQAAQRAAWPFPRPRALSAAEQG